MGHHARAPFDLEVFIRPGLRLDDPEFNRLTRDIATIADDCFHTIPRYQVMLGTRKALSDKLVSVARDVTGMPCGFCSMVLLEVQGVGRVLHLGLTCVSPAARGRHLTHMLVKQALTRYLLRQNPLGRVWVSNCAAVLSSLGNVAMHFEKVYPSPFYRGRPGRTHLKIARAIDTCFREEMYIPDTAVLDEARFIFQGSVKNTVFHKEKNDLAYHHRKNGINRFYSGLMDFEQGDEVLQIGYFRLVSLVKYYLRQHRMKKLNQVEAPAMGV